MANTNSQKESEQKVKKSFWATLALLNRLVKEDESTVGVLTALHVFSSDIYKSLREIYGEDYVAALLDAVMKKGDVLMSRGTRKRAVSKVVTITRRERAQQMRKMKRYDPSVLKQFK